VSLNLAHPVDHSPQSYNKGRNNSAKGDIAWLIMTSNTAHSRLVDIFYHIRQVAACVAKLVLKMHLLEMGGCRGPALAPFERATLVVFYRLSIVTIVLSLTIRLQFAIKCFRRSSQQGLGHFWAKFVDIFAV